MEKVVVVEHSSPQRLPWLSFLAIVTVVFSAGLVATAVIAFLDLRDLDQSDLELKREIDNLLKRLENVRKDGPIPVTASLALPSTGNDKPEVRVERFAPVPNIFEVILKAQESIFEKYCHKPNATCPVGARGEKGAPGETGLPGNIGSPGHVGVKGDTGDPGVTGLKGETGDAGPSGLPGATGPQGAMGKHGMQGDQGPQGVKGDPGPQGVKGSRGPKGDRGDNGQKGTSGLPGHRGQKGEIGDQGFQGATGDMGPPGAKGNASKKLGDGCECLQQPTFADTVFNPGTHSRSASIEMFCKASGNPEPEVKIRKVQDTEGAGPVFECVARNRFGTASKYVQLSSPYALYADNNK